MEATRLQMQNFLIFLLDLVGVTVGYFAAVWLRFGNIETGYTVMGNDTYYRWLIAIVVLMMIYFLFRPNRGFFKRKFIEEMRMNLQTVILMAAGMAMIAFLIQDAKDYSRFIYIFTPDLFISLLLDLALYGCRSHIELIASIGYQEERIILMQER